MSDEAPLLLDTCAAIWISTQQPIARASLAAMDRARADGQPIYVSPITAWEIGLLVARNRISLHMTPDRWFMRLREAPGLRLTDTPPDVLISSSFLPGRPPRDPADRIFAATARQFGLRIVTRDRPLLDYAEQGHMQAIAC